MTRRRMDGCLEAMLTPHGYMVALALSGGEGLAKLHSEPPDLVLLDILMPDMTGTTSAAGFARTRALSSSRCNADVEWRPGQGECH